MKVFFDLDRTLLNTDYFTEQLWLGLASKFNLDPAQEIKRIKSHFTRGRLPLYNFWDHINSVGVSRADVYGLQSFLSIQPLLFDDAEPALLYVAKHYPVALLTFGDKDFQAFKLACLPILATYKTHIVQTSKNKFLRTVKGPKTLIDDKDLSQELLKSVNFIHLNRSATQRIIKQADKHYIMSSLWALEEIL